MEKHISLGFFSEPYNNSPNLKIVYLLSRVQLEKYEDYIVKGFYNFLWGRAK
jgi:hypothetical protein